MELLSCLVLVVHYSSFLSFVVLYLLETCLPNTRVGLRPFRGSRSLVKVTHAYGKLRNIINVNCHFRYSDDLFIACTQPLPITIYIITPLTVIFPVYLGVIWYIPKYIGIFTISPSTILGFRRKSPLWLGPRRSIVDGTFGAPSTGFSTASRIDLR